MFEAQREACVAAAQAGAAELLHHFRRLNPATITEKTKNDFVSDADRASEEAIRTELLRRFPQYCFLGEETGRTGDGHRCWIVDPLDGTLNYVQGFPHWCVSVALYDDEGGIVGCILDPLRQDLFVAQRGEGATWNGEPITVSQHTGLDGAFLATGFAYQLGDRFERFNRALHSVFYRAKGIRRAGSAALDLAHTACGIYDGFFELGLQRWDMAAGALLVQEAGGLITDWKGGEFWWDSGDVVVGNLYVHQGLVDAIR